MIWRLYLSSMSRCSQINPTPSLSCIFEDLLAQIGLYFLPNSGDFTQVQWKVARKSLEIKIFGVRIERDIR